MAIGIPLRSLPPPLTIKVILHSAGAKERRWPVYLELVNDPRSSVGYGIGLRRVLFPSQTDICPRVSADHCLVGYSPQERASFPNISSHSSRVTGPRPITFATR